jgi:hypothetical protein
MTVTRGWRKIVLFGHRCDPNVILGDHLPGDCKLRLDLTIKFGCDLIGNRTMQPRENSCTWASALSLCFDL